jgi:hypothetical protein
MCVGRVVQSLGLNDIGDLKGVVIVCWPEDAPHSFAGQRGKLTRHVDSIGVFERHARHHHDVNPETNQPKRGQNLFERCATSQTLLVQIFPGHHTHLLAKKVGDFHNVKALRKSKVQQFPKSCEWTIDSIDCVNVVQNGQKQQPVQPRERTGPPKEVCCGFCVLFWCVLVKGEKQHNKNAIKQARELHQPLFVTFFFQQMFIFMLFFLLHSSV